MGSRLFSALDHLPVLVRDLEAFRPAMLAGYPSALELLAAEQREGRLHGARAPARQRRALVSGGTGAVEAAFDAPVRDT